MATVDFVFDNTSLEPINNLALKANFTETKAWLKDALAPYTGLVVSEDSVSEAKNDKAKINKLKGRIDSVRKTVKQLYSAPLVKFEEQCKQLTELCDGAYKNINDQVAKFDEQKRQQKISSLKSYFDQHQKKHPEYASWDRIYDPKWGNATSREDAAKEIIDKYIAAIDEDVDAILAMESGYDDYLLKEYKNGKSLSQIMAICTQMKRAEEEKKRREAEMKRQEEERLARVAEMEKRKYEPIPEAEDVDSDLNMVRRTVVPYESQNIPANGCAPEEVYTVNLWVSGTKDQLAALSELFHQAGVEYGAL